MDEYSFGGGSKSGSALNSSRMVISQQNLNTEDETTEGEFIGEGEEEDVADEDEMVEKIEDGITFIDQQIERHLTRYIRRRASDLQLLRIRCHGDQYIPPTLTNEQLILYLFAMHYNVNSAASLLRNNYKLRTVIPNFFTSRSVTETSIQEVWNILKIAVFPKRTNAHQHIVYIGLRNHEPDRFKVHSALKLFLMCADVYHILEGLPCCIIAILDGADLSYGYFTRGNYEHLKVMVKYVQEAMPFNVEVIHVVNTSLTIKTVFKLIKPFLTKDIITSTHFHQGCDLKEFIPLRCLPAEYGGTAPGSIDEYQAEFRRRLEMMQEYFDMEEEQRAMYYFPNEATPSPDKSPSIRPD